MVLFPSETDPVRVDVLSANYTEQQDHRRTRRGGQHQRDAVAQKDRENMKRFPVLIGEVDALRQGLHRRPLQSGLQSHGEGTSFFTFGNSDQTEIPSDMENGDSCQKERPSQHESCDQTEESSEEDGVFSFHTNPVDACDKGLSFHTENSAPATVCILDLGCTRAMGSRKPVDAFCGYVGSHPNSGLWYEIHPTSSRFFFANSQQSKCTEKIVIFMYDHGWNSQVTEFDIVEEGDVPLLMSLPQMRNL